MTIRFSFNEKNSWWGCSESSIYSSKDNSPDGKTKGNPIKR